MLSCLRTELARCIVQLALGGLLLGAAGLKLYGQSVSALPSVGWFAAPSVQFAAVLWELGLGIALIVGIGRPVLWFLSIGTFAVFACISGYLGWQGVADCGCFGVIKASPWHAFAVDVTALVLLAIAFPALNWNTTDIRYYAIRGMALAGSSAAILAMLAIGGTLAFGSVTNTLAKLRGESLGAPQYIDFGGGQQGQVLEQSVTINNYTNQPVRLIGGTSDCTCIATQTLPVTILPGDRSTILVFLRVPMSRAGLLDRRLELRTDCPQHTTIRFGAGCRVMP